MLHLQEQLRLWTSPSWVLEQASLCHMALFLLYLSCVLSYRLTHASVWPRQGMNSPDMDQDQTSHHLCRAQRLRKYRILLWNFKSDWLGCSLSEVLCIFVFFFFRILGWYHILYQRREKGRWVQLKGNLMPLPP